MEAIFTFVLVSFTAVMIHQNSDVAFSATEWITEHLFGWSVQRLTIDEVKTNIKKCLHSVQIGLIIIELIGFIGFVRAFNAGNYIFPVVIVWLGFAEKLGTLIAEKVHKQTYLLIVTSVKIATAMYFDNPMNVFSNTCKLITLLFLEQILTKVRYIFLKQGFVAVIANIEINENSLQSAVVDFVTNTYTELQRVNTGGVDISGTIQALCDRVANVIAEINHNTQQFAKEVNDTTNHLYKFKIFAVLLIICFLDWSASVNNYVFFSIFAKLGEFVFGSVTQLDSLMNNSLEILKANCSKIKNACFGVILTAKLASIGRRFFR